MWQHKSLVMLHVISYTSIEFWVCFFSLHSCPPPGLSIFPSLPLILPASPAPRSLHSATINYAQTQCTSLCSPRQIIQFILARLCILNDECIDYAIKQGYALKRSQCAPIHAPHIDSLRPIFKCSHVSAEMHVQENNSHIFTCSVLIMA